MAGREAWLAIKLAHGADPLAQQAALAKLADRERGIVAEAGVITDLAADEIDTIGKKPDDKRSDQEKARVVQLKNLDLYLIEARNKIADARRKLQELAAEDGVARAEDALNPAQARARAAARPDRGDARDRDGRGRDRGRYDAVAPDRGVVVWGLPCRTRTPTGRP